MDGRINIPAELLDDEIVCFLADRYHATSIDIVRTFFEQDGITPTEKPRFRLEDNEMEIMRDLTQMVQNN